MKHRSLLLHIGIVVLAIVIVRVLFPEKAELGNKHVPAAEHSLVIIPMAGVPPAFLATLEKELENQHQFQVLVTTHMGKGPEMVIEGSGQYHSGYLAAAGKQIALRIGKGDSFIIVLTNEDINTPESGLRFNYSTHYEGMSVVSLARINPSNFGVLPNILEIPEMYLKMTSRALKLINKSIGYGIYGYEASSDWNSVMYGPIMGPSDLDRVGEWY